MNSIFSSFDALSAEFLGKSFNTFNSKFPASTVKDEQKKVKHGVDRGVAGGRSKSGCSAKWAPEFDGVNCFESLVFN
ncbi:hypothetical protein QVD17_13597 [Tagetes erecta]|uniref:Uncharacterized protein n=1 Tax=Tagetes erecta TaxID=13708 RepID=A0AAD8L3L3_TARER|nr:hypothetical protein QVD17_13597 [Tagetes erecta]